MPLTKLQFKPGINREVTSYSNEGGWRDCDKIRFRFGYPEKMGGWSKYTSSTYLGTVRALHNWIALDGSDFLGLGSHIKYYIEEGQNFNDITPVRKTTSAGEVTFTATNNSNIIKVTNAGHGAAENDFVSFTAAESLGPNITAALLNTEHQITAVLDADNYQITLAATANTTGVRQTTVAGTSAGAATHTGKTQSATSGSGTGAEFTVIAGSSSYGSVTVTNIGTGYAVNDTITIPGTSLGGSSPTNDLTITVTSLDGDILDGATSGIKTMSITASNQTSGVIGPVFAIDPTNADQVSGVNPAENSNPVKTVSVTSGTSTGSATFTNVTGTSSGAGAGAKFTITTDGSGGYTVDAVTDGGDGYDVNENITIVGTSLGGATTANDLVLNITSVEPHTFDLTASTGSLPGSTAFTANFTQNTVGFSSTQTQGAPVDGNPVTAFTFRFFYTFSGANSVSNGGSGYRVGDTFSLFLAIGNGGGVGSSKTFRVDSLVNNTTAEYQINVGLDTTVGGTGWGAGQYYGVTSGALQTTLNEGGTLSSSDTTITLTSTTGIVANDVILIDNELILVGGVSSTGVKTVGTIVSSGGSAGAATHTGKAQTSTSGSGTGAQFTVVGDSSSYTSVTATTAGSGYAVGDTITIAGNTLGGATPLNDVTFTITAVTNDLTGCTRGYAGTQTSSNVNTFGPTVAATHADGSIVRLAKGNADPINDFSGWGDAASGGVTTTGQIRLWSHDNLGEDLLLNPRDDEIYYWDKTNTLSNRAVKLNTLTASAGFFKRSVPTKCKQVLVSDRDRHVIAFGSDGINSSSSAINGNGIQDPLLIRFSNQEDPLDWYPTEDNTAGDLRLGSGSTFVQAVETKREILVWTDTALTSMRFIGPPFTFGLQQLSSNITIMSPNAAVATEDFVFWMGLDTFYVYAGQTQTLPCSVKDKVFLDFNLEQRSKVIAGINSEFSEVTWFYPSANGADNDRYVTYNYSEKVWYFGTLERTAWLDRGTRTFPLATGNNYLYNHEFGYDDDGSAMNSFIESAAIDIGDGDRFTYLRKVIPDLTFDGSTNLSSPQATFTVKARNNPGADFNNTQAGTSVRTQSSPVEKFTEQLDLRVRGRSFALRVESDATGSKWKLGSPRVDIRQDGRR